MLRADGVPFEVLDPAGCIAAEPGLARVRDKFVGGLRLPNDETGDCFKFTNALQEHAEALGVDLPLRRRHPPARSDGDRIAAVRDRPTGRSKPTPIVVALGSYYAGAAARRSG